MRLPISSSSTTTHATTASHSMGGYGKKKKNNIDANARSSVGGKNSTAAPSTSSVNADDGSGHTNSTSNRSSRRSFKGRNSFRKTRMLRKANTITSNSQRGQLLQSTFTVSDDAEHSSVEESREGNNDSPPLPLTRAPIVSSDTTKEAQTDSFPNRFSVSSLKAQTSSTNTRDSGNIPIAHVETILSVFGNDDSSIYALDLYRDVLHVSPDVSERDIRIAYFRRGREVLSEAGIHDDAANEATAVASGVMDPTTRTKFQALSMAYEILSNPAWKNQYLETGGLVMPSNDKSTFAAKNLSRSLTPIKERSTSTPTMKDRIKMKAQANAAQRTLYNGPSKTLDGNRPISALRESSFRSGVRKSLLAGKTAASQRSATVRWSEHVEELVFEHDPNEHFIDDDESSYDTEEENNYRNEMMRDFLLIGESRRTSNPAAANKDALPQDETPQDRSSPATSSLASSVSTFIGKRRKNKPRVIIESDELESHLQRMDDEAEKHFVQDFFDTFEESMSGVLSLVDSFADSKTKPYKPSKQGQQKGGSKRATLGFVRSMSHDTADLDRDKKTKGAASPASSMEGDTDGLVKRSKSFPQPEAERIVVDCSDIFYDDSINVSSQIVEHATKSNPGAKIVSPTSVRSYPPSGKETPSLSSRSGSLFRPISPSVSESSDLLTIRSDQFDLESLAMSDLANPFREEAEDSEIFSEPVKEIDESFDTVGATTIISSSPTPLVKSKRVAISMVSTVHEAVMEQPVNEALEETMQQNAITEKSPGDDVFEGLDEQAKNKDPMGMSLQRNNSMAASECLSDLSESVFQHHVMTNQPKQKVSFQNDKLGRGGGGADTPFSEASDGTTVTSNIAPPRRPLGRSYSESSVDSTGDPLSAMDLLSTASMGDGETIHSVETAMEANGFFEYFVAYVSAIVTECASDSKGPHFSQDIMSLFGKSTMEEEREPPARTQSMASSVTSVDA